MAPQASFAHQDPDRVWGLIQSEARQALEREPCLRGLIEPSVLAHASFESMLGHRFAAKLASDDLSEPVLRGVAEEALGADPAIGAAAREDLLAVLDRDPACHEHLQPPLYFKGYIAIQSYRIAHWHMRNGGRHMAYLIQMRVSEALGLDINPSAVIGKGIMIDHAHSIVIGETAVVGDNVSMLHSVTLGGTGKEDGDRHPKIGDWVLIGAGAKVLGNVKVGCCSRVAAGSVVLKDVPAHKTVAGVPARIVGEAGCENPSLSMDHLLHDYG